MAWRGNAWRSRHAPLRRPTGARTRTRRQLPPASSARRDRSRRACSPPPVGLPGKDGSGTARWHHQELRAGSPPHRRDARLGPGRRRRVRRSPLHRHGLAMTCHQADHHAIIVIDWHCPGPGPKSGARFPTGRPHTRRPSVELDPSRCDRADRTSANRSRLPSVSRSDTHASSTAGTHRVRDRRAAIERSVRLCTSWPGRPQLRCGSVRRLARSQE